MKESFSPLYELDSHGSTISLKKIGRQQVSNGKVDGTCKLLLVSTFNHGCKRLSQAYCRSSII